MPTEEAEKTEPATPKRQEDSKRKGQVAQSRELPSVAVLVTASVVFGSGLTLTLIEKMGSLTASLWSASPPQTVSDFHAVLLQIMAALCIPMFSIILLFSCAGVVSGVLQTGPMLSFEALQPRANRLSLQQGFKRLFDLDRLFDLGKGLFKVGVVGTITWVVVSQSLDRIIGLSHESLNSSLGEAGRMAHESAIGSLVFLGIMAIIDVLYQRWRFDKRQRMSKKEVRDELKDREGNPQVRSRARAMQREMSRSRIISAVSEASVVVTNPTHFAVALQYTGSDGAPLVLAKGRNQVAARIREVARKHGVPIVENKPLARLLHRTAKVGQEIPEPLYQAVAEVLAYIYRLQPHRNRRQGVAQ